ncbi:MAG: clostripain-related cysteine peptidase [Eubacteriales bacterium]|nr:clostripain-related cysteine peptidase [Eubacteriales bacterium]
MCGSDLESKAGAASTDLEEILNSGLNTERVNVVVMAGGTTLWKNELIEDDTAVFAAVSSSDGLRWEKQQSFRAPEQDAPANMGEQETLRSFLEYGHSHFPAENYALIMWDHGGGPMRGLCWDTAWAKDNLTMQEFIGALADSPFAESGASADGNDSGTDLTYGSGNTAGENAAKFSWIGFDACLMSSIETAHLIAPYADYMIASEETEPGIGWSYNFLKGIDQDADGAETGKRIVDTYFAAAEAEGKDSALTLSCTDLSRIGRLEDCLDAFFKKISSSLNQDSFSELSNLRQDTREFGKAINDSQRLDLVDLGDLVSHYASHSPEDAEALEKALQDAVLYSRSTLPDCSGLSAYHPYYNKTYFSKLWQGIYESFSFAPSYTSYLNAFAQIWMGETLTDWTQMSQIQEAGAEEEMQYFSMQLTQAQLEHYAAGQLLVLSQIGSEAEDDIAYAQVFLTEDVSMDDNGILTAGYSGRTLYATDENGQVLAGPLSYSLTDDGHLQIEGNYVNHEGGADQEITGVLFECEDAPVGTDLPVLEQYVWDDDTGIWSNRLQLSEEDYQRLYLLLDYRTPSYRDGQILPFDEWEHSTWAAGYEVSLPSSLHFRFFDQILTGSYGLYAGFQITDTQANHYGTELMPVNNPNVTPILFEGGQSPEETAGNGGTPISGTDDNVRAGAAEAGAGTAEASGDGSAGASGNGSAEASEDGSAGASSAQGSNDSEVDGGGEVFTYENDRIRLTLTGQTDRSELSRTMILRTTVENVSDTPVSVNIREGKLVVNEKTTCFSSDGQIECKALEPGQKRSGRLYFDGYSLAGISDVSQMQLELTWPEEEKAAEQVVLKPLHLNLNEIAADPESLPVLSECTQDDIRWTLRSVLRKRNGNPCFLLCGTNTGEKAAPVPSVRQLGVNGIVLDEASAFDPDPADPVLLAPSCSCNLYLEADNHQCTVSKLEHRSGVEQLLISDVLGSGGVDQIESLAIYPAYEIVWWGSTEEALRQPVLHFSLSDPVPLGRQTVREEQLERDAFFDSENGTARALDLDGKLPSRILLCTQDDVSVYGEEMLIADRKIFYSLVLENAGSVDRVLRMDHFTINGQVADTFQRKYISYAGTSMRVYLSYTCPDSVESDTLKEAEMSIWQDGDPLPAVHQVSLSFPEGTAFNTDGGISFPVEEASPEVTCLTEDAQTRIFENEAACPADPAQYKKPLSFRLPESFTEEQTASIRKVNAFVMYDCTDHLDPGQRTQILEKEKQEGIYLQPAGRIQMQKEETDDKTYTGIFPGLVWTLKEEPEVCLLLSDKTENMENSVNSDQSKDPEDPVSSDQSKDPEGPLKYAFEETGYYHKLAMIPNKAIYTGNDTPSLFFDAELKGTGDSTSGLTESSKSESTADPSENPTDAAGNTPASARIRNIRMDTGDSEYANYFKMTEWPFSWFEKIMIHKCANFYVREDGREDSPLQRTESYITIEKEIPLSDCPLTLQMVPVKEFSSDLYIIYHVVFEDGSMTFIDGGRY